MAARKADVGPFRDNYIREFGSLQKAAEQAEKLVRPLLSDFAADIHLVTSRAKDPESAQKKIQTKSYNNPEHDLTDKIGVRIITYYSSDVDRVVEQLAKEFEIDVQRSTDKRRTLGLRSFGYRSVHLIVRLKGHRSRSPEYAGLAKHWFEIQVRSILEHAWAEIEHEVVYKSGIRYPSEVRRRFAAIAGALELIEREFLLLKDEREKLIEEYKHRYDRKEDGHVAMDTARFIGFLESVWPTNPGWRSTARQRQPFPPGIGETCVLALRRIRSDTANSLRRAFRSARFKRAMKAFSTVEGLPVSGVSHLALVVLAIALKDKQVLEMHFPDMARSPAIAAALRLAQIRR